MPDPVRMEVHRTAPFGPYLDDGTPAGAALFLRANPREGEACDAYMYDLDPDLMLCRFADTPEGEPGELFNVDNLRAV